VKLPIAALHTCGLRPRQKRRPVQHVLLAGILLRWGAMPCGAFNVQLAARSPRQFAPLLVGFWGVVNIIYAASPLRPAQPQTHKYRLQIDQPHMGLIVLIGIGSSAPSHQRAMCRWSAMALIGAASLLVGATYADPQLQLDEMGGVGQKSQMFALHGPSCSLASLGPTA